MFRRHIGRLVRTATAIGAVSLLVSGSVLSSQQQKAPSARDIVDRFVKAIGGREAYKKVSSMRSTGSFELPAQGIRGNFEMVQARPAKARIKTEIPGIGAIEIGYDGKYGWQIDQIAGPALLTGRKLTELADDSWFDGPLYESDFVKSMTVVEQTTFDSRPAHKLQIVFASGSDEAQFFDAETGLRIGSEARRETPLGIVPTTSMWREYKLFGPIRQPTVIVQRPLGIEQIIRLTAIEYDVVPPDAFEMPPQIKALIKS
jgi:hypothetical protein